MSSGRQQKCQSTTIVNISTIAAKISLNKPQNTIRARFYIPENILLSSISTRSQLSRREKAIFLKKQHSTPSAFAIECQLPHARNSSIHATLDSQCSNVSSLNSPYSSIYWFWLGTRLLYPSAPTRWFIRISRAYCRMIAAWPYMVTKSAVRSDGWWLPARLSPA